MAGGLTSAIGEALLQLVQFVWPSAAPQFGHFAERVADVVRPDPPFSITTQEGEVLTGVLVVERGRVLLFFGVRDAGPSAPVHRPPQAPYPGDPDRGYVPRGYDADQSLWSPRPYQR